MNDKQSKLIFWGFCLTIAAGAFAIPKYREVKCMETIGKELNTKRQKLGIPAIPSHWHIRDKDKHLVYWMDDNFSKGHESKRILFTNCTVDEEIDIYVLSARRDTDRTLEIRYKYANTEHFSISYQIGHYAHQITLKEADSILLKENIEKN